jgi:hypothetical protein
MPPFLISLLLAAMADSGSGGASPPARLPPLESAALPDDGWKATRAPEPERSLPPPGPFPAALLPPAPPAEPAAVILPVGFAVQVPGADEIPPGSEESPIDVRAPLLPATPAAASFSGAVRYQAATAGDRWRLMRELQGTWPGVLLDDNRLYLYGWLEGSYNASSVADNNTTVTWNDRANKFLLQQGWIRFGRSVVTSGTTDPTWGFQVDLLAGTDYRYTMQRGFFNSQLLSADGNQNLYGVDTAQSYVNLYVPNLFRGTEFRVGKFFTPWGVESVEAVSTPLPTRSYAFNWCPPFTHCGLASYTIFSPQWSAVMMAVNGNDVYFGDPSAEWRFVGNVKYVHPNGRDTVTLATSVGRGKFNTGDPFAAPTFATINEPLGRNNINVFDLVWTHQINPKLAYNLECIYGYQTNVPIVDKPDGGTAHWWSAVHYLFYTLSSHLGAIGRFETFDDVDGQRTGFEGMYLSTTVGLSYKPTKSVILRPELRFDYNLDNRPFEGKHGIFLATTDLILRW